MARLATIAPLFLLSGGTALLYQVAFGKRLATVFGATAYAVSAVLAAFMGGLALGAYLGGRYGARIRRPLVGYGLAEWVVGGVCVVTPALFQGISDLYLAAVRSLPDSLGVVSALRALTTALVVLVPTVAMGVTLPWLARAVAGPPRRSGGPETERPEHAPAGRPHTDPEAESAARQRLALLYAVNTAGGALGAMLGAYAVLPALGVDTTMRAAAAVNFAIGLCAIILGFRRSLPTAPASLPPGDGAEASRPAAPAVPSAVPRGAKTTGAELGRSILALLIALAFASGLLVFSTEVAVTHLLALLIGNSAFAFGLMLAVFLTCLAAGAALAHRLETRLGGAALPTALLAAAGAMMLTLPVWDEMPRVFVAAGPHVQSWYGREMVRAAVALAVLLIPTTCMGLTFPLLLRSVAGRADVAKQVGRLTAVNTAGSIIGSLACGYLILPALGSEWTLRVVALCFAGCGGVAAWVLARPGAGLHRPLSRRTGRLLAGGFAGCVALALLLPRWDLKQMTNGANVYFEAQPPVDELVFVREDVHGGWTSVARRGATHTLYTNGKFQGDDGGEIEAQRSFAHFPVLFVPRFERALVIGLGTGTTLGTIASYPFEAIEVAETSPAIVEAAATFFSEVNRDSLDDPRVDLQLNDGRNVLLVSTASYDLITIELSSVWFAGSANLYSREFYELCRRRLGEGGVLQQWVQLHHIHRRDLAVILRTVRKAFEHVALFEAGRQGIIVASAHPLVASRQRLAQLGHSEAVRATLPPRARERGLAALVDDLVLSGAELDRFVKESESPRGGALISTDENLYLEHATPKGNVMRYDTSLTRTLDVLASYRPPAPAERHLTR